MPFRYADRASVLTALKLDEGNASHTAAIARVEQLENGIAATIDSKTGRTFGTAPVADERTVTGAGRSSRLILQSGVTSVTAVEEFGTWDGVDWANPTVLTSDEYALALVQPDGLAWALDRVDGTAWGLTRVTALWGDQGAETVPVDIQQAANFLTVDEYRMRTSSPAGEIGPEGLVVPVRNPWNYTMVKAAIEAHTVVRMVL